jgi:hypothetical protein
MEPALDVKSVRLPARTVHRIEDGQGLEVTAVSGVVWITQSRDARDVILARAQSFILDRRGRAVVYALRDAVIVVGPAKPLTAADLATPAPWDSVA